MCVICDLKASVKHTEERTFSKEEQAHRARLVDMMNDLSREFADKAIASQKTAPRVSVEELPAEQVKQFALDVLDGKIIVQQYLNDLNREIVSAMVFPRSGMGLIEGHVERLGTVFEYLDKAVGEIIPGLPMFATMRVLAEKSWLEVLDVMFEERKRRADVVLTDEQKQAAG